MNPGGTVLFLMLLFAVASCTSLDEAVNGLDEIHSEVAVQTFLDEGPRTRPWMDFAPVVEDEEVDDPVDFCMDRLASIGDGGFSSSCEKARAVSLLCRIARRSPAQVVRACALRTLGRLEPLFEEKPDRDPPEKIAGEVEALRFLFRKGPPPAGRTDSEQEDYLALIDTFASLRFKDAHDAWAVTEAVIARLGRFEEDEAAREAFEYAAERMAGQAAALTAEDALRDPAEIVRTEAVDLVFRFPWERIRGPLEKAFETDPYLQSPLLSIRIYKALLPLAEASAHMGLSTLKYIVEGFEYAHPGRIHYAVLLLQEITRLKEEAPAFWEAWWDMHLFYHADSGGEEG